MVADSRLPNFRALSPAQRFDHVVRAAGLTADEAALLGQPGALGVERANGMIENVIGTFELPLAVAGNFQVNGRDVLVPMVVEEPSVVAAASYMAKLARECGGFQASSTGPLMRAQVQILGLADPHGARQALLLQREAILAVANSRDKVLIGLGGGCRDIEVHVFDDAPRGAMVVMHLIVDVRDAMGANTVNTMAEAVSPLVEKITGGTVRLRILSNLADLRLARARVRLTPEVMATAEHSGERIIEGIVDACTFAVIDPYRAATHNKGIMNGIDPVIVATGNDWRAVEAGAHAYACRSGRYTSLTRWEKDASGAWSAPSRCPCPWAWWAAQPGPIRWRAWRCASSACSRRRNWARWPWPWAWRRTWAPCARSPQKASSAATWRCMPATSRWWQGPRARRSTASPGRWRRSTTCGWTARWCCWQRSGARA